jgi:hypothetical protein
MVRGQLSPTVPTFHCVGINDVHVLLLLLLVVVVVVVMAI